MSEKEINSYRFNSGQEPSDEMLAQVMKEVAHDAREKHNRAVAKHRANMQKMIATNKELWAERINSVING